MSGDHKPRLAEPLELLDRERHRTAGRRWYDWQLRQAAIVMGLLDQWNQLVPDQRIHPNRAYRLLARHVAPDKTAGSIGRAMRRPHYRAIRQRTAADWSNAAPTKPGCPDSAQTFMVIWSIMYAEWVRDDCDKQNAYLMRLKTRTKRI